MREEKNDMAPYSLTDIEQYLRGELPPAEMHAIEKAALQDPFLADAIEGYRTNGMAFAQEDLSSIHEQLPMAKQVSVKWKPSSVARNIWWQAAAAIVLVAGATTLGWRLLNGDAPKLAIAQNKQVAIQQKTDSFKPAIVIKPVQVAPPKTQPAANAPTAFQQPSIIANTEIVLDDNISANKKITPEEIAKIKGDDSLSLNKDRTAVVVNAKKILGDDPRLESNVAVNAPAIDSAMLKPIGIKISDSLMGHVAGVDVKTIGKGYDRSATFGSSKARSLTAAGVARSQKEDEDFIFPPLITTHVSELPKVDNEISFNPSPKNGWPAFNRHLSDQIFLSQKDISSSADSIVVRIRIDKTGTVLGADILHTYNATWNSRILRAIKSGPGWNVFSLNKPESFSITISRNE